MNYRSYIIFSAMIITCSINAEQLPKAPNQESFTVEIPQAVSNKEKKFSEVCDEYIEKSAQLIEQLNELIITAAELQKKSIESFQKLATATHKPTRKQVLKKVKKITELNTTVAHCCNTLKTCHIS